jgi:negative regulator of sigma E activity
MGTAVRRRPAVRASILALLLAAAPAAAEEEDARALVQRMIDSAPRVPFFAKARLSSPGGCVRELEVRHRPSPDGAQTLMEVIEPADVKDTRFLSQERRTGPDRQFVYMPAVRRAIEVMEASRSQPFLGSDFFVSDFVAPDLDDFTYRFVGNEEVGGRRCKLIEATPKEPAKQVYGKTIAAIDATDHTLVRTQFFDQKGNLFKVWTLTKVETIDGVPTPKVQEMENVQKGSKSRLELIEIKYRVDLPDTVFGREYLTR